MVQGLRIQTSARKPEASFCSIRIVIVFPRRVWLPAGERALIRVKPGGTQGAGCGTVDVFVGEEANCGHAPPSPFGDRQ
jgi:hypothetical protein